MTDEISNIRKEVNELQKRTANTEKSVLILEERQEKMIKEQRENNGRVMESLSTLNNTVQSLIRGQRDKEVREDTMTELRANSWDFKKAVLPIIISAVILGVTIGRLSL